MDEVDARLAEAAQLYSTTRYSDRWGKPPGNQDLLHANVVFPGDGPWGIPQLAPETTWPLRLFRYEGRFRKVPQPGDFLHFFIDDYRFEVFWRKPRQVLPVALKVGGMLGPDFSITWEMPRVLQLCQVYRNRWLSRYAQVNGVKVIPTVRWADATSLDFCLLGLPKNSLLAVSTQADASNPHHYAVLHMALKRLVDTLSPRGLVVYGERCPLPDLDVEVRRYPTTMEERKPRGRGLTAPARGGLCNHAGLEILPDHCPCNFLCGCRAAGCGES